MAININRNVDDTFYRYKMPRLLAKVEGKGNGIKTVIANMVDIAKALNRPPTYPTKYFGCELGAQTQFDLKNDRYIVNGDHDAGKLQDLLDGFIRKFVLCQECDNPETTLLVKGQKISLNCKACGYMTVVDPRHRLTTFVIKNPAINVETVENGCIETSAVGKKTKNRQQRGGKDQQLPATPAAVENGHGASGDSFQDQDHASDEGVDDNDWSVNPDDVEERQRELIGNMVNITMNDDLEKSVDERLKIFMDFLKSKSANGAAIDPKAVQVEAERLDVKDEAALVVSRVLFESKPELLADPPAVKRHRALLLRFTAGNERAQRHLLGSLEQLVCSVKDKARRDSLLSKMPRVLELLYDADVLEEKQILKWGEKTSSKYVAKEENKEVRARAAPFLKWLKEAEEESEGDEEDDDGVEVVYDNKPQVMNKAVNGSGPVPQQQHVVDAKDDLDIDNI